MDHLDVIENIDQNIIAKSIEDMPTLNDDTQEQEVEVEAITEAIEKEINESPPDPEESEVMEEMAKVVHRGNSPVLFTFVANRLNRFRSSVWSEPFDENSESNPVQCACPT